MNIASWMCAAILVTAGMDSPARADPMFDDLAPTIKEAAAYLKQDHKQTEVAIARIAPKVDGAPQGGEGELRASILSFLKANGIEPVPACKWALVVLYEPTMLPNRKEPSGPKEAGLRVTVDVKFDGGPKECFKGEVYGAPAVMVVGGKGVDGGKAETTAEIQVAAVEAAKGQAPPLAIEGGLVRASSTSDYGMEVLVDGKPLTVTTQAGLAVIRIPRDKEFEVRLTNRTVAEAAVDLRLDGVSAFALSDKHADGPEKGRPLVTHYLVPPKGTGDGQCTVHGWYITPKQQDRFVVKAFPESVAARVGQPPTGQQTITALFAVAWIPGQPEPKLPALTRGAGGEIGIGQGPRDNVQTKVVPRNIGPMTTAVTIRYEADEKK